MPREDAISTKWPVPGRAGGGILTFLVLLAVATKAPADATRDAVIGEALDRMLRMEYAAAEKTLITGLSETAPPRPYFAGLVCLNRFLDEGDTSALSRAEGYWASLTRPEEPSNGSLGADLLEARLYRGLAGLQLAHVSALRGARLRSASQAYSARRQLAALEAPEARMSLMLYDYWRDRILEKLPLVRAAEFPLEEFSEMADASRHMETPFRFALFWIHLDAGRPDSGRLLVEEFLARYPDHRLAREMRAVALFRLDLLAEARAEQEKLRKEYAALARTASCAACLPLGYYRATGNLARIAALLGPADESATLHAEWSLAAASDIGRWLPESLRRDLSRLPAPPRR